MQDQVAAQLAVQLGLKVSRATLRVRRASAAPGTNHAHLARHGLHLLTGPLTDAAFHARRSITAEDGRIVTRANAAEARLAFALDAGIPESAALNLAHFNV